MTWVFLAIAFFFLLAWSMMLYSRIFRFTFIDWPFFGAMTVTSFVTLLCSTGFAIVCVRNYDKGLAEWCKHDSTLALFREEADDEAFRAAQYIWKTDSEMTTLNPIYSQLK